MKEIQNEKIQKIQEIRKYKTRNPEINKNEKIKTIKPVKLRREQMINKTTAKEKRPTKTNEPASQRWTNIFHITRFFHPRELKYTYQCFIFFL